MVGIHPLIHPPNEHVVVRVEARQRILPFSRYSALPCKVENPIADGIGTHSEMRGRDWRCTHARLSRRCIKFLCLRKTVLRYDEHFLVGPLREGVAQMAWLVAFEHLYQCRKKKRCESPSLDRANEILSTPSLSRLYC